MSKHNPDKYEQLDESLNHLLDSGYIEMKLMDNGEVGYQITESGSEYFKKLKERD